jgi:SAM-dependent methyltransferase
MSDQVKSRRQPRTRREAAPNTEHRLEWVRMLINENGWRWTGYAALLGGLRKTTQLLQARMARLEQRHGLPGRNGRAVNYRYWERWNWSRQGEEWTVSTEWKQALIDDVLHAYLPPQSMLVEIGPGAGRWTEALLAMARHLVVVDISDRCIDLCRQRFAGAPNIELAVNDGKSLPGIASGSIDGVWSYDVFVHIALPDIEAYLAEISRVLKPGGRAVIHHARAGRQGDAVDAGQRSAMTATLFADIARRNGLSLVTQLDSWGPDGRFTFSVPTEWDLISVVEKSTSAAR